MRADEILELLKLHPSGLNNKELGRIMGMHHRSVKNITRVFHLPSGYAQWTPKVKQ